MEENRLHHRRRRAAGACETEPSHPQIASLKTTHLLLIGAALATPAAAAIATFETLPLGDPGVDGSTAYGGPGGGHYWNGSNEGGFFTEGGATFLNEYTALFDSWAGFAYSNTTDSTSAGFLNQYSAVVGGGFAGSANYAVGYFSGFGPVIPTVQLAAPTNLLGIGAWVTNTTYTAFDMLNGSGFSKKFGGASGNDPDFLQLIVTGFLLGNPTGSASFYLADFRFADNMLDYIVTDWQYFDLSALGVVDEVRFTFDSSDVGAFGINTPTFFAMDNFGAIPEPGGGVLALLGLLAATRRRATR